MHTRGVRSAYVASSLAARAMVDGGAGLRTENVVAHAAHFDLTNAESPQFTGRAIAALAADPAVARHNGTVLVAAELAAEYRFTDVDGR